MRGLVSGSMIIASLLFASPVLAADKGDQLMTALKIDDALETTFTALAPLFGAQVIAELERQLQTDTLLPVHRPAPRRP